MLAKYGGEHKSKNIAKKRVGTIIIITLIRLILSSKVNPSGYGISNTVELLVMLIYVSICANEVTITLEAKGLLTIEVLL